MKIGMKWKTGSGTFLIQDNLVMVPFVYEGVGLAAGERYGEAGVYVETTLTGEVVNQYSEPLPFGIDSEMTVSNIHRVIGDCLYRFYYCQVFGYQPRIQVEQVLCGLELYEGELPFSLERQER